MIPKNESASSQHFLTFPPAQNSCSPDTSSVASTSRSHHRAAPFETARPAHGAPSALGRPRPVLLLPTAAPKDMSRVHPTCDGTYSLPPKTQDFKRMTQKLNKTSTKPWFYRGYSYILLGGKGLHSSNPFRRHSSNPFSSFISIVSHMFLWLSPANLVN